MVEAAEKTHTPAISEGETPRTGAQIIWVCPHTQRRPAEHSPRAPWAWLWGLGRPGWATRLQCAPSAHFHSFCKERPTTPWASWGVTSLPPL